MMIPRILIYEHPPINKDGIGKTLYAFFYNWSKKELAQIYTVDLPIDEELCQYHYISETGGNAENTSEARELRENKRNSRLFHILSNFAHSDLGTIFRSAKYLNMVKHDRSLEQWIDNFSPECVFYGIGENVQENLYILELAKTRRLPLVLYVSDDYMTKWLEHKHFKGYAKKLYDTYKASIDYASLMIVISDKMEELYRKQFPSIDYLVASNSAVCKRNLIDQNNNSENDKIVFSYTGNLGFGRWQMLSEFSKVIDKINRSQNEVTLYLEIYSQEKPAEDILNKITDQYSSYHTNVIGDELDRVRINANVLLLVESFDSQYESILSTALSTKVPEYLSYGKNIFAWAPYYAWSLDYLKSNNAAYCVSSPDIENNLYEYVNELKTHRVEKYIENGNKLFDQRHEFYNNANRFSEAINKAIDAFCKDNTKGN